MSKVQKDLSEILINLKAQVAKFIKLSQENDPTIDLKKEILSEKEFTLKTFSDISTAINRVAIWQEQKNEEYSKALQKEKEDKQKILNDYEKMMNDCNQFRLSIGLNKR